MRNCSLFQDALESDGSYTGFVQSRFEALLQRLSYHGYSDFLGSFNPTVYHLSFLQASRSATFPGARTLLDFFLLNKHVWAEELDRLLGDAWRPLITLGVASLEGEFVKIESLSLIFAGGLFLFTDRPTYDPVVYFGDDSIALLTRVSPVRGDYTLDLCSGSGVIGLRSALIGGRADAVELNDNARRVLELNALLNGLRDRVELFGGSLFSDLPEGRQYDLVSANPPLVPFPDDLAYPFVGHGGADGFAVTRNIIAGLRDHLTDRGRAQIIGLAPSDGYVLRIDPELKALAKKHQLDIKVTLIRHTSLDDSPASVDTLAMTAAPVSNVEFDTIKKRVRDQLNEQNATHLAPYFLLITRGDGRVVYQNFARFAKHSGWFVDYVF